MAATFFFMTTKKDSDATLFVRLQSRKHHINYKMSTTLTVNIDEFNDNYGDTQKWRKYSRNNVSFCKKVDAIADALNERVKSGV